MSKTILEDQFKNLVEGSYDTKGRGIFSNCMTFEIQL